MARQLNNLLSQSHAPLLWEGDVKNAMAGRRQECPNKISCSTQSGEETGEMEGQGPCARGPA